MNAKLKKFLPLALIKISPLRSRFQPFLWGFSAHSAYSAGNKIQLHSAGISALIVGNFIRFKEYLRFKLSFETKRKKYGH